MPLLLITLFWLPARLRNLGHLFVSCVIRHKKYVFQVGVHPRSPLATLVLLCITKSPFHLPFLFFSPFLVFVSLPSTPSHILFEFPYFTSILLHSRLFASLVFLPAAGLSPAFAPKATPFCTWTLRGHHGNNAGDSLPGEGLFDS